GSVLGNDGDLPVALENRELDLIQALQPLGDPCRLEDVAFTDACPVHAPAQQTALLHDYHGFTLQVQRGPAGAALEQGKAQIEQDQRDDHQYRVGDRMIITQQRLTGGLTDHQQQQEIEGGDIRQRPSPGDAEHDQQGQIDSGSACNGVHGHLVKGQGSMNWVIPSGGDPSRTNRLREVPMAVPRSARCRDACPEGSVNSSRRRPLSKLRLWAGSGCRVSILNLSSRSPVISSCSSWPGSPRSCRCMRVLAPLRSKR